MVTHEPEIDWDVLQPEDLQELIVQSKLRMTMHDVKMGVVFIAIKTDIGLATVPRNSSTPRTD